MTAPTRITGPDDLAKTVRNATDPLEDYPNYGTAANAPGDQEARPSEISEQIGERRVDRTTLGMACENFIASRPLLTVALALTTGAAIGSLLVSIIASRPAQRF